MIEIESEEIFGKAIADALSTVGSNTELDPGEVERWVNAIAKAAARKETSGVFMDYDKTDDRLAPLA